MEIDQVGSADSTNQQQQQQQQPSSSNNPSNTQGGNDQAGPSSSTGGANSAAGSVADAKKPRFELKKYNAVALWSWGNFLPRSHFPFIIPCNNTYITTIQSNAF